MRYLLGTIHEEGKISVSMEEIDQNGNLTGNKNVEPEIGLEKVILSVSANGALIVEADLMDGYNLNESKPVKKKG